MALPKTNTRGLQDIRTLSGRVDQTSLPYRAYMKIACLEMEKARRGKERESAAYRLANIDSRVKEIEAEKASLLQSLAAGGKGKSSHSRSDAGKDARPERMGQFRLKY